MTSSVVPLTDCRVKPAEERARIFNIQRYSLNDGAGIRTLVFFKGCPLHCPWCSNPESRSREAAFIRREAKCIHCGTCALDVDECPSGAYQQMGTDYTLDELMREVMKDEVFFRVSGGGVTLSGGEVTVQFAAAKRLLQRLKEEGIHTAIETNGAHRRLGELFPLVDCLIIDFKHHDDARLRAATGVGSELIKRSVRKALVEHPEVLIRIPLIGGFNDSATDAEHFAAFFRPLDTGRARFEFLRYHEFGKDKWAQCGLPYRMERMKSAFVDDATVAQFHSIFAAAGLHIIHT